MKTPSKSNSPKLHIKIALACSVLALSVGCQPAVSANESPTSPSNSQHASATMLTMSAENPQAAEVKAEIDHLMDCATSGKMDILDTIYHKDMKIFMFSPELRLTEQDKPNFIAHLKDLVKDTKPSRWAHYHKVEANEKYGHVLISRKFLETEEKPTLTLSIDLIHEDDRWQITREVIFMH